MMPGLDFVRLKSNKCLILRVSLEVVPRSDLAAHMSRRRMKNNPHKKFVATFLVSFILLLSGCGKEPGPSPEIHDTHYAALNRDGESLAEPYASWSCVLDKRTGLVWEAKTDQPGLHDWRNTYSWYAPDEDHGSEAVDYRGTPNGGQCAGSDCDTWAMVQAVNQEGLCGHRDWRMPLRDELASISDPRKLQTPPTINLQYFPHTQQDEYWSGNDYHFQYDSAWVWSFRYGQDRVDWKKSPKFVRLVRGEATGLTRVKD